MKRGLVPQQPPTILAPAVIMADKSLAKAWGVTS